MNLQVGIIDEYHIELLKIGRTLNNNKKMINYKFGRILRMALKIHIFTRINIQTKRFNWFVYYT